MHEVAVAIGACPSCETVFGLALREKGSAMAINEGGVCGHCLAIVQRTETGLVLVDEKLIPLRLLNQFNQQRDAILAARKHGVT
jgi:hypothetical protein